MESSVSDVVRLDAGKDAVRAYVSGQAAQGLAYVVALVEADNERILTLIGDLTEAEATRVTPADEWCVTDAMRHLAAGLDRSKDRLEKLSSGTTVCAARVRRRAR